MKENCELCGKESEGGDLCFECARFEATFAELKKLREVSMSDDDLLALDDVRAICHGGGAAVALAIAGEGELNLKGMQEMLREASKKLVAVTEHYGGWDRIAKLRGIN